MLGFRFVSLSQVLHPVINASGLSCHKYQGWRFGIPQAAMKTPSGFHGNCVLQDSKTRCTRADLAPCKVIHLPSACCSPRITCIFLLSSAFQSVASPYREGSSRKPPPHPKDILLHFFSATIQKPNPKRIYKHAGMRTRLKN